MTAHKIASRDEWQAAREELLRREKEHTREGDALARVRRELPWLEVEKEYRFETDDGPKTLAELFDGRSQLLVYHFMFGPSYEAGCTACSSNGDSVNGVLPHLNARDVTLAYVSRAPLEKIQAYRRRMGWDIPWASSADSDFNFDFGVSATEEQLRERIAPMLDDPPSVVSYMAERSGTDVLGYLSEAPALSVFALDGDTVYQTYHTGARGLEIMMTYYPILDRVPKGRDESSTGAPHWLRRHDEY
jgi:predicted dithiol-disulfide oxidoreductase (DUF899 family)